jgi:phosphohistidine phosphatase
MRQLLLLRHAKSSWDDAAASDHARVLNADGQRAAAAMGQALRTLHLAPDLVLVSTARRTLQTLDALEPWDETPLIEPMDSLYLASAPQLLATLNRTAETVRSVMLIGHNPGLHDLALTLAAGMPQSAQQTGGPEAGARLAAGFPTGALAEFTIPAHWAELAQGGGRLVRFLSPRDLSDAPPERPR